MVILGEFNITSNKRKTVRTQPRERKHNFLKYLRVVKYYVKRKYNITSAELDMLLYLYDVPYFRKDEFSYYEGSMSWDKRRFYTMVKKGFIKEFRPGGEKYAKSRLHELTHLGKNICSVLYKKLMKEELISESPRSNPIFKKETYSDKIYKAIIEKMNSK